MPNKATTAAISAARAQRRAAWAVWYDRVAVERCLSDWTRGQRSESVGRQLSPRERRVVMHALRALGVSINEAAEHLRVNQARRTELLAEPHWRALRDAHRDDVAAAVRFLRSLRAEEILAARRAVLSSAEVKRICSLAIGHGNAGPDATFDAMFATPRR